MSITPFLKHQAFDPDTIQVMAEAYERACQTLGLVHRDDQLNALIAEQIIRLAQRGMRNPTAICMSAVKEFTADPH